MENEIDFECLAQDLARERVDCLEAQVANLKKNELPAIRKRAENVVQKQMDLYIAIGENPVSFAKPGTKALHGIKFGYQKCKGEIRWEDEARVVELIRKHFPDQAEILIKTTETPVRKALAMLPEADLKKIGVAMDDKRDEIVIRAADSDVDKIVSAILATPGAETP